MSFSLNVKSEILNIFNSRHCSIAEISSIINYCAKITYNPLRLIIYSENGLLISKAQKLLEDIFNMKIDVTTENNKHYKIIIEQEETIMKILNTINQNIENLKILNNMTVNTVCCKRAYIRGAFICAGYICTPQKNYHVEFSNNSLEQAEKLKNLINFFEIEAKIIEKKENFIVYIKEGEQIFELLNIMEAHKALVEFENIRILKDVRNNVNRIVNCETANLNKIVFAGIEQVINIEYIKEKMGLDKLPKQLKEIAILRLENPDASLKELSEMTEPTISKSGVNHRLKKLNIIAESLRRN